MTDPASPPLRARRRPHPAAASRILVAGAATAGTLALAGLMARTVDASPTDTPLPLAATTAPAAATAESAPPVRIVVVRRHHPATGATATRTPAPAVAPAVIRSAPPVQPAPRPAPPTTTSRGS